MKRFKQTKLPKGRTRNILKYAHYDTTRNDVYYIVKSDKEAEFVVTTIPQPSKLGESPLVYYVRNDDNQVVFSKYLSDAKKYNRSDAMFKALKLTKRFGIDCSILKLSSYN